VEESRTNYIPYSETILSNTTFGVNRSIDDNVAVAPDGTTTAARVTATAADPYLVVNTVTGVSAGTYTFSVYLKGAAGNSSQSCKLRIEDAGTGLQTSSAFDITTEWDRYDFTVTTTGNLVNVRLDIPDVATVGDIVYVWGLQIEAGSFPTSYIPTEGSTVTRAADVASITGTNFSSWYRQDEGTMFANAICPKTPFVIPHIFCATDGTTSNRIRLFVYATLSDKGYYQVGTAGAGQCDLLSSSGYTEGQDVIAACVYKANDFAASYNGGSVVTDNTGTVPSLSDFLIGTENNATNHLNSTIRRLTYWPTRLPNDTLKTITT